METKFKVGDKVYCYCNGWGKVINTDVDLKNTEYPILVFFENKENEEWFTNDGKINSLDVNPTLSFTEYTLQGFSQERPIELPEVGEEIMVSDKENLWVLVEFVSYNKNANHKIVTTKGNYKYFKRLR